MKKTETIIHLDNVWKVYQIGDVKVEALRGINIKINLGEFLSIHPRIS